MFTHRLTVRFRDCDAMGHVNHAVYFTYMEQCRFAWWRHLGGGVGLPGARTIIVHADCDYLAPAHVHDEIEIALRLESLGRSSITLQYTLTCTSTQQTLAQGRTINVTVDPDSGKSTPMSPATRALLQGPV